MEIIFELYKHSKTSFLYELDNSAIKYQSIQAFSSEIMASGVLIAIAQAAVSSTAVAAIVVAWLKARASRKIVVTTKANQVVHLEGYSVVEVEKILALAVRVSVIDTKSIAQEEMRIYATDSE
jgi:hypothetical protein